MYKPNNSRYENMKYRKCGNSGLKLPTVSLGLWHNFGAIDSRENARSMVLNAFDLGITHFDLGNNYGPPQGSAEQTFGWIVDSDLRAYRDEIIVSTKAGFPMWTGPYQDGGSRKYLVSSLDASLKRLGLEYVDIFYHHRPDPETPLEETMGALDHVVRQGKALYAGVSNYYDPDMARKAFSILKGLGTPVVIHQPKYNMFKRDIEDSGLLDVLVEEGIGSITFSPLAQGLLTDRYIAGVPEDSRAHKAQSALKKESVTSDVVDRIRKLNAIAEERGQSLAQMALAWNLRHKATTSVLIGASKVSQIEDCVRVVENMSFSRDELNKIDEILG